MEAEYMNFRFNEEQQMMRKMVRDFAQKEIAPFVPSMEQGVFPKEILQKMGELGLMEFQRLQNTAGRNGFYFLHFSN